MLPCYGSSLDRRFRFSFDDEAIKTLGDQYRDRFRNTPDNARLGLIRQIENRQQLVFEDWIWIQNQDASFHRKHRKLLVGEQESCLFQRWQWWLTHPGSLRRRRR